jgi:hypothetical protein
MQTSKDLVHSEPTDISFDRYHVLITSTRISFSTDQISFHSEDFFKCNGVKFNGEIRIISHISRFIEFNETTVSEDSLKE